MRNFKILLTAAAMAVGVAGAAHATVPVYPASGTTNATNYSFTAAATGDVWAYFALDSVTASYTEDLGLKVNGVDTGLYGLVNHSTNFADGFNFGSVNLGDTLDFFIRVYNTGDVFHTNTALNADGFNHVWATPYAGGDVAGSPPQTLPAGTYVAFEDLYGGGDRNYHDEAFVFTNVKGAGGAPEPATWAMMIMGFGAAGSMVRRRRTATA